jgi:hypothetical protein
MPFEMVGDEGAAVCVDGVCALPEVQTDASGVEPD